jgi:hypothetical protein
MAIHLGAGLGGELTRAVAAQGQLADVGRWIGGARRGFVIFDEGHDGNSLPHTAANSPRRLRTVGTERPRSAATSSRVISSTW